MRRGIRNASDGVKIPFSIWLLGSRGGSRQNYSLHEIQVCCSAMGKGCTPSPCQVRSDTSRASPRASSVTPQVYHRRGNFKPMQAPMLVPRPGGSGSFRAARFQNGTSSLVPAPFPSLHLHLFSKKRLPFAACLSPFSLSQQLSSNNLMHKLCRWS